MGEKDPDDLELVEILLRGDRGASNVFCKRREKWLVGEAARMLAGTFDSARAEDAFQEACSRAWEKRGTFTAPADKLELVRKFEGFLLAILRHHCIDLLRSAEGKYLKLENCIFASDGAGLDEIASGKTVTPSRKVGAAESATQIKKCFEKLSAIHQQVLQLSIFDGMTYDQIAEKTGKHREAISGDLRRAKAALRACMGESGLWVIPGR
jgi:RNA polymerase sigma factor (sigma-70 family)